MGNNYVNVAITAWAVIFLASFLVFMFTLSFEATFGHNGEVKFVLPFWAQLIETAILSSLLSSILVLSGVFLSNVIRNKSNNPAKMRAFKNKGNSKAQFRARPLDPPGLGKSGKSSASPGNPGGAAYIDLMNRRNHDA